LFVIRQLIAMNKLLIVLVLSCASMAFSVPVLPTCNTSVLPTAGKTAFGVRLGMIGTICDTLCSLDCVASPRLLNPLNRCLNLTVSTNEDFDKLKKFDSLCVLVGGPTGSITVTKPITLGGGLNCVKILNGSSVDSVIGGNGDDYVFTVNATVSDIDTKGGDDIVVLESSVVKNVITGDGRDIINITSLGGSLVSSVNKLDVGGAGDYVFINNATIGSLDAAAGRDIVHLNNTVVRKDLDLGSGDDYVYLSNVGITKLKGGDGFNVIHEKTNVSIGNAGSDSSDDYYCM